MVNVLICDDDIYITQQLYKLLNNIQQSYNIEFNIIVENSGNSVTFDKINYDIAILDIEMPEINGLTLAEKLKINNPDTIVIILTSFSNYLDSAMKIQVFRYLSKPIDTNRFNRNFLEAIEYYKQISKQIIVETSDEVFTIKTKNILYIENLRHGSMIVTKNCKYKTNKKPQEWYVQINQPNCFVYSHKSFLVNLKNVINFNKTTIYFQGVNQIVEVASCISQRRYSDFKKAFFDFAGGL
jgi:two-component system LytT family response regulator